MAHKSDTGLAATTLRVTNIPGSTRVRLAAPSVTGITAARQVSDLPGESSPQGGIQATAAVIAEVVRTSIVLDPGGLRYQKVLNQAFGTDCTYAEDVDVIAGPVAGTSAAYTAEGPPAQFPVTVTLSIDGEPAERHFLVTVAEATGHVS